MNANHFLKADLHQRIGNVRIKTLHCISVAALLLACTTKADLSTGVPPADNFDLSHWKLTLPVDATGGSSGEAVEVSAATLVGPPGYSSSWFYTASDGGMRFWVPVNGATTDDSSYARSELREVIDPSDDNVNWYDSGNAALNAQCAVNQAPSSTGKVVVGQIHGFNSSPLLKLEYVYSASSGSGKLVALLNQIPGATSPSSYTLAKNVALNQSFSYAISVDAGVLSMSVNGGTPVTLVIDGSWAAVGLYFKAGAYGQATGSSSSDGSEVTFYSLVASHPSDGVAVSGGQLAAARVGFHYHQQLSGGGGGGKSSWSLASGRLPRGLHLSSSGLISGIPALGTAGAHGFTAQLRDAAGDSAAADFALQILPLL